MMPPLAAPAPRADRQHIIERGGARELRRQHFEQHVRAALGRLAAQRAEFFGHLRNIRAIVAEIADLDVMRAERFGGIEQQRAGLI